VDPPDAPVTPVARPSGLRRVVGIGAYELKTQVARRPSLALPLSRFRRRGVPVGDDTDIVIESFPRCASSFAVAAFRLAQEPRAMTIANHTHMPAQVIAATRRGIPAIVLIREPEEAVLSHVIHTPSVSVAASLRGFVRFYEPLLAVRHGFVVGTFHEVVNDFGTVIARANDRFGTSYGLFEHTPENLDRLNREIETDYRSRAGTEDQFERTLPLPSAGREAMKERLRADYRAAAEKLRHRAEAAYEALSPRG
jgi:hypothetical protein